MLQHLNRLFIELFSILSIYLKHCAVLSCLCALALASNYFSLCSPGVMLQVFRSETSLLGNTCHRAIQEREEPGKIHGVILSLLSFGERNYWTMLTHTDPLLNAQITVVFMLFSEGLHRPSF